ncbi:malate synthase [Pseudoalteromonas citrea]|uniref:Malate synthase n=3 Tax=Pseudoalteromonas citrea TaxID=43655 RepID=A0AAD4ADX6_9GAMM|nr:malate synthase [Pseudoalteromonas citrea]
MTALTRSNLEDTPLSCQKLELAKRLLDEQCPLDNGSHSQTTHYVVYYNHLMAFFADGSHCGLKHPNQFVALCGHKDDPTAILLKKSDGLHIELTFNRCGNTGKCDNAHIDDIQIETQLSALNNEDEQPQLKRLWVSFLTGVQHSLCETSSMKQYTDKQGNDYQLNAY